MKNKKIKLGWTCSNVKKHSHKYKWVAYLCGRQQFYRVWIKRVWYELRKNIYTLIKEKAGIHPAQVMPLPMVVLRWIFFPIRSFWTAVDKHNPYDMMSDTWNIYDTHYGDGFFVEMSSMAEGHHRFTIIKEGDRIRVLPFWNKGDDERSKTAHPIGMI